MYQIGQICIGQNFIMDIPKNGMECEIIDGLKRRKVIDRLTRKDDGEILGYKVKWSDGDIWAVEQIYLRPKHEPGSWDELEKMIGWRPGVFRPYISITYTKETTDD